MSMQDPIADMFTRIRNAQSANKNDVLMPSSKVKVGIAEVLKNEGFIDDYQINEGSNNKLSLLITLKYFQGKPVIDKICRVSRPGLRIYKGATDIPKVDGFGISILSTSRGILSHKQAKALGVGGEIVGEVE
ncbi:MAG: 30S ribosomal protein S8 [Legionellaceae bacterium]